MQAETATQTPATDANSQPASTAPASTDTLLTAAPATAQGEAATPAQPTAETNEAKPAEGEPKAEEKPQGAPEEYADFVAPEGVTLNADAVTELKAFAKEKNLTQEEAQKLVDLGAKNAQQIEAHYREQIEQTQAQWAESSRTDKEFGGDKLTENLAVAKRALETFGSPELTTMLRDSGLGNNPEIIRAFYRVGKAISEDRLVAGTTRPSETDVAKKMYPTMTN